MGRSNRVDRPSGSPPEASSAAARPDVVDDLHAGDGLPVARLGEQTGTDIETDDLLAQRSGTLVLEVRDRVVQLEVSRCDTGVRRIQSVTCTAGTDIGLFSLVLVQPTASLYIRGVDAPAEVDFLVNRGMTLPVVKDDAYLNFISHPAGSLSGAQLLGLAKFVWS